MGDIITGGTLPQVTVRGTKGKSPSTVSQKERVYLLDDNMGKYRPYYYDEGDYKLKEIPDFFIPSEKFFQNTGYGYSIKNLMGRVVMDRREYPYGQEDMVILPQSKSGDYDGYRVQKYDEKTFGNIPKYINGLKYMFNNRITKKQQGGQLSTTQQQGLQYLAQMYAQQTGKDPQQDQEGFMQFVQQLAQQAGVQDIGQLLDMIYQQAQGQAQAAKHGAKLNYLKKLAGRCPEGTELRYFKAGGQVCSKCVSVQKEKCGSKMKKKKACGGTKMKFQPGGIFGKISNFINGLRDINSITDHSQSQTASHAIRNGVIRRNWIDGTIEYLPQYPTLSRSLAGQKLLQKYFNAPQSEVMYSTPEMLPEVIITGKKTK